MDDVSGDASETVQESYFWIIELVVCALLFVGCNLAAINILADTNERMIAKDLSLTIMAVSSSPGKVFYKYAPNTEIYQVDILDDWSVSVKSSASSAKFGVLPLNGLSIIPSRLSRTLSIPIQIKDSKIFFEDQTLEESVVSCRSIPASFSSKPKIILSVSGNNAETVYLNAIKNIISVALQNEFEFVEYGQDALLLSLSFSGLQEAESNKFIISYSKSETDSRPPEKISCMIVSSFRKNTEGSFSSFEDIILPEDEIYAADSKISIKLGSYQKFISSSTQNTQNAQNELVDKYASAIIIGLRSAKSNQEP